MEFGLLARTPFILKGKIMKSISILTLLVYPCILFSSPAENIPSMTSPKMFILTSEEMVFASKLSDKNRHKFCYAFSPEERKSALALAKSTSPNESVEKVQEKVPLF